MRHAAVFLLSLAAAGAQAQSFTDQARVRHVEPRYETVQVPRRECAAGWMNANEAPVSAGLNYGGIAIGAVAGGLIGNQIGNGRGRQAATAVGAVVGALAGDRLAGGYNTYQDPYRGQARNCRDVVDSQNRIVGYDVTYDYRGQQYTTFTRQEPGPTLAVQVTLTVVPTGEAQEYSGRRAQYRY